METEKSLAPVTLFLIISSCLAIFAGAAYIVQG